MARIAGDKLAVGVATISYTDNRTLPWCRFDYVIPIGPPDVTAREAIWRRYLPEKVLDEIDVAALVETTEPFTPCRH